MRIAFLTNEYITENNFSGGLASYLYRASLGLRKKGHEINIFVLSNINDRFESEGIIVHRVKPGFLNKLRFRKLEQTLKILIGAYTLKNAVLKYNKIKKIDIIQCANYLATGYFIKKINKIPVVTRISSFTPFWRTANGASSCLDDIISEALEMSLLKKSDGVYSPSELLSKLISMNEPLCIDVIKPPFESTVKNIDIDIQLFNEKANKLDYLLFYGSIMKMKGVDFLLDNLEKIFFENETINIIFIGRFGKKHFFDELSKRFNGRIHYYNAMRKNKLLPFIKYARAVVIPSIIDNLPNTCLESMALGKIVVTTDTSGFEGVIRSGDNGFLIKFGDDYELCRVISKICTMTKEQIESIGSEAKTTIFKEFSEDRTLESLISYYKKIIYNYSNNKYE